MIKNINADIVMTPYIFKKAEQTNSSGEEYIVTDLQGTQVANVELRWGTIRMKIPDKNGDVIFWDHVQIQQPKIYEKFPREVNYGNFFGSNEQREQHLKVCSTFLTKYYTNHGK